MNRCLGQWVYAAGHFAVDFSCALVLLSGVFDPEWFLIYNFCAFALQMPIGLLADMVGKNRLFSLSGSGMVLLALLPFPAPMRAIFAGVGNACYHVGGGREALFVDRKMTGLGLFVSPGTLGIYLGSVLAGSKAANWAAGILLGVCVVAMILFCSGERKLSSFSGRQKPDIAGLMLLVVLIRSVVGLTMQSPWKTGIYVTLAAVLGALGKAAGGILGDKLGGRRSGVMTLLLSSVLFCFPDWGVAGLLGIFFFNMTMPITLRRAADALPGSEGLAFGLLTFALFLGYLPSAMGWDCKPLIGAALAALSALLMGLDKEKQYA